MSQRPDNSTKTDEKMPNPVVKDFVLGLSGEHKMLIVLKTQLYGGRWDTMHNDLEHRLEGKPYIFKLANRINDDMDRIKEMQDFEQEHNVNLADYVDLSE